MTISTLNLRTLAFLAGTLAFGAAYPACAAGTVVKVSLWDKGDMSMDKFEPGKMMGMGMGMMKPGMGMGHGMEMLGIKADKAEVPAGEVTFEATNNSKSIIHEMILSPIADVKNPLPYVSDLNKVDEDAAGHLGEVSELEPGKTGSLKLTLKAGNYVLFCNIPGHYAMGMWALVTVK